MSIEKVHLACRSLERLGAWLGWGLPVLGLLASVERLIPLLANGVDRAAAVRMAVGLLGVAQLLLSYGFAGAATYFLSRLLAASVATHFERSLGDTQSQLKQLELIAAALERQPNATQLPTSHAAAESVAGPNNDRAVFLSRIHDAIRGSQLVEAAAVLGDFAVEYPDDPRIAELEERLRDTRLKSNREQMAQLDAAREVNDPDRVLEIYLQLAATLEADGRTALDRDLAKWFLTLIHRRLRTGTIQADVVQLASRFSEAFATTVEGASVRAALPTLRRSVGLCPRCAQPYVGVDQACPTCLKGGVG